METEMNLSVWLVLTPNVLLLDYAGPAEALRMARDMGAPFTLHTCAVEPEISSTLGVGLSGLEPLPAQLPTNSLVIVVGNGNEEVDYRTAAARTAVQWLQTAPLADTRMASICSGALLLAQTGLLRGHRCTTHHSLVDALQQAEPSARVEDNRIFVDDGQVLTSAGISTGIDLALYLVEEYAGAALAAQVARRLVIYHRREPQDPQLSPWWMGRHHVHPAVHRAQDAMARDPVKTWTLPELAATAFVSPRHLSRLFTQHTGMGVAAYQQQLRLAVAKDLMRKSPQLTLESVALQSGFGSARDFRRVWGRHGGRAPAEASKALSH